MQASPTLIQQPRICVAIRPGREGEIGLAAAREAMAIYEQEKIDAKITDLYTRIVACDNQLLPKREAIKASYIALINKKFKKLHAMQNTAEKVALYEDLLQDYANLIKIYA